ncbi:MAG: YesL family protein [Lachnospiraceae bacterium]|nr:YesL family protein [Lachnospiraceae bacterium]
MRKIFDVTNPFWTFVGRLVDAALLHLCWLLCCIPVVTAGASTTALYAAMMKDVADEDAHYIRAFFKSFKQNLGQGIILGLIYMVIGAILAYAIYLFHQLNEVNAGGIYQAGEVAAIAFSVLWLMTVAYAFALLARFYNTIPRIIMNAFFLAFKNFGWTMLIVALIVAYGVVVFWLQFMPILFVGYGLVALIHAYILNHVFKPLIAASLGESDPDAWTVPEEEELKEEDHE